MSSNAYDSYGEALLALGEPGGSHCQLQKINPAESR